MLQLFGSGLISLVRPGYVKPLDALELLPASRPGLVLA